MVRGDLLELLDEIRENKRQGRDYCSNCPLRMDNGPALIECADVAPQVVVVSESPVHRRNERIAGPSDIKGWICRILEEARKNEYTKPDHARYMGPFLGSLTAGRVYEESEKPRTHVLYWTHTVKCFLQNKRYKGIREAKKERKRQLEGAVQVCGNYLTQEIARTRPKLIIAVGKEASKRLKDLKIAEQLAEVVHPAAWGSRVEKIREDKLAVLRHTAKELGLVDILPRNS